MGSLNGRNGRSRGGRVMRAPSNGADDVIHSFGCHLSWPELHTVIADRQTLSREEQILAKERWDYNDRPTYYTSVRNLQGFIAYHLGKRDAALRFFQDVEEKDNSNINALGNLAFVYERRGVTNKEGIYKDRLKKLLSKPSYQERATAYADKAHAIRYFEQFKRGFRYMRFIERAATIGKKCIGPHRAEWFFDYALALYRRDVQMLYLRKLASDHKGPCVEGPSECYSDERIKEGFLKACWYFLEVARTSTSRDYQALSWIFLGILVNHDPEHRSISMAFPDEPNLQGMTAEQCYRRGLEIHPEHEIVNRRVGSEYVKLGLFNEAQRLLDKSIEILPSQFAYRHRALMFLNMYLAAQEEERRTQRARDWLEKAVEDFNRALSRKEFHADYSDLGYVYFLLGDFDNALDKFQQATESDQDDYFDTVVTYQRWAECLEKTDQIDGIVLKQEEATDLRRQILETPLEEAQSDYFSDDFDHYSTKEKPGFVRILQDYHFWAASSRRRNSELNPPDSPRSPTRKKRYRYDFFVWHADRDRRWTVAFVHKMESEHGRVASIDQRDFEVGREISREIIRCLRESYKFVVILTPCTPSQKCAWESFTINQAVMESSKRGGEYIVPIKLRDCTVPDELATVITRECEEGQILKEHWEELVGKLTQR